MIKEVLGKLARQVFSDDEDNDIEKGYADASLPGGTQSANRTLSLMTPVEHNSLASLSSHIASTARGEVFTPPDYSQDYAS